MRADDDAARAGGDLLQHARPRAAFLAAGEKRDGDARALRQPGQCRMMLARQKLGGRHQRRLGADLDRVEHGEERHHRLAAADIALKQPLHARGLGHVGGDLGHGLVLPECQREGQGVDHLLAQPPGGPERASRQALLLRPHQRDRQLVGKQLIEGQAPACRRCRQKIVGLTRRMRRGQRRPPGWPARACAIGGILPFRQFRRAGERRIDRLRHHAQAQARGQAVDRLDRLQPRQRLGLDNVVGMRDLDLVVEGLDAAAHYPRRPDRQQPLEIVALHVEEDEVEEPGLVAAAHAIGLARIGRLHVCVHRHRDGGDGARRRILDQGPEASVDDVDRQVP